MDNTLLEILSGLKSCQNLDAGIKFLSGYIEDQKDKEVSKEVSSLMEELLAKLTRPTTIIEPVEDSDEGDEQEIGGHVATMDVSDGENEPTIFLDRLTKEVIALASRPMLLPIFDKLKTSPNPKIRRLASMILENPEYGFWRGFWATKDVLRCHFCLFTVPMENTKRWTNLISHLVRNHASKIPNNLGMNKSYAAIWAENH